MVAHTALDSLNNDELADELERRGYLVFNDQYELGHELSDGEVLREGSERGLFHFESTKEAIGFLEAHGWHVHREDLIKEMWQEIYDQVKQDYRISTSLVYWFNKQFNKHLGVWL